MPKEDIFDGVRVVNFATSKQISQPKIRCSQLNVSRWENPQSD
jgi:hypothetical protein